MNNSRMPDIKVLFHESWALLKEKFGSIFLLSLLGSVVGFIVMIVFLVGIAGAGFLATLSGDMDNKAELIKQAQSFLTPAHIAQLGGAIFVVLLVSWVIGAVVRIAIIVAIGKKDEKVSLGSCLSRGFSLFIPVMIVGSVVSFAVFGSFFLFIVPAIIISLLFQFVTYEMILGEKKWFTSLKSSVQIMSQHFGEVLLRMFLFFIAVYLVVNLPMYLIQMVARSYSESAPGEAAAVMMIIGILRFLLGIFVAFYGLVYSVVTYQHAKNATDESLPVRTTWIWVVNVIGWIIAILIGIQLTKFMKSPEIQEQFKTMTEQVATKTTTPQTEQEKIDMWRAKMSPETKALWDQSEDLFKQMREAATNNPNSNTAVKQLNDQNITILKEALLLDDQNPEIWINLSSAYTWVSSSGSLQEALEASKKAELLDPSITTYAKNTAEMLVMNEKYDEAILKLQQVLRENDNYGRAHILLGIAYKRTGLNDSAKAELQRGIDILTKYNKEGNFDVDILQAKKELETIK